ncbi:MAG: lysozyme inhibitor LprI family protein [Blastocatellia bacterium]
MKTTIRSFLILFAAVSLLAAHAIAQRPRVKPGPQTKPPCAGLTTQSEMNRCAQDEYKKVDAELNRVYQQVISKLEPEHRERLKIAQRAWLTFRDAHCDCEAFTFNGGSMQPLSYYSCLSATTKERITQLRQLMEAAGK